MRLLEPVSHVDPTEDAPNWWIPVVRDRPVERWEFTDAEESTPRYDQYQLVVAPVEDDSFVRLLDTAIMLIEKETTYRSAMDLAKQFAVVVLSLGRARTGEALAHAPSISRRGFADLIAALGDVHVEEEALPGVTQQLRTFSESADRRLSEAASDALDLLSFRAEKS